MKFLVVDDEKFIRDVITGILENLGHEFMESSNGSEALVIQKTFKADILLTDIRMPGMSGIELAIKVYEKYKIPIILVSGYSAPRDMEKLEGVEHYFFSKPIKINDLSERIDILAQKVQENQVLEEEEKEEISLDDDLGDDDFYDEELMDEFLTEGFDMLDDVEPRLIETAETVILRPCWELRGCENTTCPLYDFPEFVPCWSIKNGVNDRKETVAAGETNPICLECDIYNDRKINILEIDAIFRVFHSFKGSSSFLGLNTITSLTHEAESVMDFIRKDKIVIVPEIIDILMDAVDALRLSMRAISDESLIGEADENAGRIITDLKEKIKYIEEELFLEKILSGESKKDMKSDNSNDAEELIEEKETPVVNETKKAEEVSAEFEISPEIKEKFAQESAEIIDVVEESFLQMEKDNSNPVLLSNAFRNIHSFKGNCGFMGYKDMENVSHKMESILENLLDENMTIDSSKIPILLDMLDLIKGALGDISNGENGSISGLDTMLKSLEDELGIKFDDAGKFANATEQEAEKVEEPEIVEVVKEPEPVVQPKKAEEKVEVSKKKEVKKKELAKVNAKVTQSKASSKAKVAKAKASNNEVKRTDIRVDLEKLDILMDLVGELVIAGAMVSSNDDVKNKGFEDFEKSSVHLNSIIKDLQDVAMNVRMIPIAGTFSKMMRLVHDLARKSKKKVKLVTSGEQTEVDKTVIEMIGDPLVHIIRNAVDHGIEPEDLREESGKSLTGNVSLDARYEGGEVWITIKDDGKIP